MGHLRSKPKRQVSINMPRHITEKVNTLNNSESLSQKIRHLLFMYTEYKDVMGDSTLDLSSLSVPTTECDNHTIILTAENFKLYHETANKMDMSLNSYILHAVAHALHSNTFIDYELPALFDNFSFTELQENKHRDRKQPPRYRIRLHSLDILHSHGVRFPLSSEFVSEAVDYYLSLNIHHAGKFDLDMTEYAFKKRHKDDRAATTIIKLNLPVWVENAIDLLSRRQLIGRGNILVMALATYVGIKNADIDVHRMISNLEKINEI